uniref:Mitochondrial substrate carrier family protein ucpB n=1 Tax=Ananas comosus var. bracteatus TaxID=296719 RepID=A0A6V7NEJ9_ANACO|nr:unnamed protein product [Ananas comosus var. bracteatus]
MDGGGTTGNSSPPPPPSSPSSPGRRGVPYAVYHFSTSGAAVAVATTITHPLDVLKVRLQMQLAGQRGNLGGIFTQMVKTEGAGALYLGLAPALTRSVLYGGLRLSLYEPCKYTSECLFGSSNFGMKFASGAVSGALATALTNPTEVLKVRLQMNSNSTSSPLERCVKLCQKKGLKHYGKESVQQWPEQVVLLHHKWQHMMNPSRPCSSGHLWKKRKLHSWDSRNSCNSTSGHDQNPINVAARI